MLELVGYFYGVGALIVALSAFSLGRISTRSSVSRPEAVGAVETPVPPPVAEVERAAAPVAQESEVARSEPRRSRLLRRRGSSSDRERRSRPAERQG
jgi:hypothetical protein